MWYAFDIYLVFQKAQPIRIHYYKCYIPAICLLLFQTSQPIRLQKQVVQLLSHLFAGFPHF